MMVLVIHINNRNGDCDDDDDDDDNDDDDDEEEKEQFFVETIHQPVLSLVRELKHGTEFGLDNSTRNHVQSTKMIQNE